MIFAEVFGMPVRIARYEPTATDDEKRELLHMLESLGSNAAGIFSRAVDLQIVEANRGTSGPPYERLVDFLDGVAERDGPIIRDVVWEHDETARATVANPRRVIVDTDDDDLCLRIRLADEAVLAPSRVDGLGKLRMELGHRHAEFGARLLETLARIGLLVGLLRFTTQIHLRYGLFDVPDHPIDFIDLATRRRSAQRTLDLA